MPARPHPASVARLALVVVAASPFLASRPAPAEDVPVERASEPGTIDRVTVYPQGAAVTRTLHRDLGQGLWEIRVTGLPKGVDPRRLQARVRPGDAPTEGAPRLLGVEYEEAQGMAFAGSPEGTQLAGALEDARQRLRHATEDRDQLAQHAARIEEVAVRAVANATALGGTATADPARALEQLAWVDAQRTALLGETRVLAERIGTIEREIASLEANIAQRGRADRVERSAVVRIAAPTASTLDLDLTYVVDAAAWRPAYAIRAAGDRSGTVIEYDAVIAQATGEPWNDVRVSLSTAEPADATQPTEVEPVWVDAAPPASWNGADRAGGRARFKADGRPGRPPVTTGRGAFGGGSGGRTEDVEAWAERIAELAADAGVREAGIAATFELPRRVNVPSDGERTQRTRIASLEPSVRFVHVAQPLVDDAVYVRGDMANTSGFQLLPGTAQVYMGGDLIGDTRVPSVAPKSEFKVFFGPDRAVRVRREVLSKVLGSAGLFAGSNAVTWKYRTTIDNGTGRELDLELIDRRPASRDAKIEIKVADLSEPLSKDTSYAAGPQKSGILRWDLKVPATARGNAAQALTWTVQATYPKDVQVTPLPD